MDRIYPQQWMALDKDVKDVLKKEFDIKQTGVVHVIDSRVADDGYLVSDLAAINVDSMNKFVDQTITTTFNRLWELTLAKVQFILHPPVQVIQEVEIPVAPKRAKWCYYCESKGFSHKPECTRPNQEEVAAQPDVVAKENE